MVELVKDPRVTLLVQEGTEVGLFCLDHYFMFLSASSRCSGVWTVLHGGAAILPSMVSGLGSHPECKNRGFRAADDLGHEFFHRPAMIEPAHSHPYRDEIRS